jgi:hypothetical protein
MPVDPTANAQYMVAAYIITAVILLGYGLSLWRRFRKEK